MNDDQHVASESELGALLNTTTPDLEGLAAHFLRLGHRQNLPILKTQARETELN